MDKTRWKVYGYVTWYHFGSLGKCRIKISAGFSAIDISIYNETFNFNVHEVLHYDLYKD